ncbi:hypothetical protein [Candidatus Contubernalis alkaliaceticus]|uniref:hypothetical protein n=1 Tax=Candidatus Contubernalis alkaliaceticus TaxID=338645 RepID=UPI001F4C1FAB|nr:hypothetical protein [Candidatus Contubernalis alkalaceticus]UNC90767.1 hypothetical protein HUE98_00900 [Candidatus Contubernalis alkalaceticus]
MEFREVNFFDNLRGTWGDDFGVFLVRKGCEPMGEKVKAVIFEGGNPQSVPEKLMFEVRNAILLDNLEKMKKVREIDKIFLSTNYSDLARDAASLGVEVIENNEDNFHFGTMLQKFINEYSMENVFYFGGASIPLIQPEELREICKILLSRPKVLLSNNSQSADLVAFRPASMINHINLPPMDNMLANVLRDEADFDLELMPLSLGIVFDLDTPMDILLLAASSYTGERTREVIGNLDLDLDRIFKAKKILAGYYEDIVLMGRVGAHIIAHINTNLKCRLRIFSEERGMKALGRMDQGEVVALMGFFVEEVGIDKFFEYIERTAACALIDSRVLFAHFKLDLTETDRFYSDLGMYEKLQDPFAREFTRRAVESTVPVLLGGHSLISGGLWALANEIIKELKN